MINLFFYGFIRVPSGIGDTQIVYDLDVQTKITHVGNLGNIRRLSSLPCNIVQYA